MDGWGQAARRPGGCEWCWPVSSNHRECVDGTLPRQRWAERSTRRAKADARLRPSGRKCRQRFRRGMGYSARGPGQARWPRPTSAGRSPAVRAASPDDERGRRAHTSESERDGGRGQCWSGWWACGHEGGWPPHSTLNAQSAEDTPSRVSSTPDERTTLAGRFLPLESAGWVDAHAGRADDPG